MATETSTAGAKPAKQDGDTEHFDDAMADAVLKKHNITPRKVEDLKPAKGEATTTETPEEKTARETAEAEAKLANETPEEKAAREQEEAEAAAKLESETPEAKAEREAQEAEANETTEALNTRLADLPKAQRELAQTVISERVGRVVAQEKEKRDAAEAKATEAQARVTELEAQLAEAEKAAPVAVVAGLNPLFAVKTEAELNARLKDIRDFERWARRNSEGYISPDGDEAKNMSKEQIDQRLYELEIERDDIIPEVRQVLAARATVDATLQKTIPALFKAGTEENRAAQAMRKLLPELGRFANANELIARLILGEKALKALANPLAKKVLPSPKPAPRAPGGGGASKGGPGEQRTGTTSVPEGVQRVMQNPDDRTARSKLFTQIAAEAPTY